MKRVQREPDASLGHATLEELQQRFPREWIVVGEALVAAAQTKRPEALTAFVQQFQTAAHRRAVPKPGQRTSAARPAPLAPRLAMARMAHLAVQQMLQATAARLAMGHDGETLRFDWWSGWMIQRLLFARGLERKPVSVRAFRWLWPLIPQRRRLMPLVMPRGIYCFYSRELILALADRIGPRACLEIAAGDGTLARFLKAAGANVHASDDRSWSHAVTYPDDVEDLDAAAALREHQPAVVICSFPPPDNPFEQRVLQSTSVDLYMVITTRHRFAAGNWESYAHQTAFDLTDDKHLARLVLPPEIEPAVLIFRRR
jgi:hypothetical protein